MTKNMVRKWSQSFATMRNDERGAEATEVIFILVIVVLGLAGAFILFKDKLVARMGGVGDCLDVVGNATACVDGPVDT